jgi:hypothetical protein
MPAAKKGAWDAGETPKDDIDDVEEIPSTTAVDMKGADTDKADKEKAEKEKAEKEKKKKEEEEEAEGKPSCCSRCCGCCGSCCRITFKVIGYFFLYLFGFVFLNVFGVLHLVFRILHTVLNIFAQCRRADIDVMQEIHYDSSSELSGSDGDKEREELLHIEEYEREKAGGNRNGGGGAGAGGWSAGQAQQPAEKGKGAKEKPPLAPPKRTREQIAQVRAARKLKKVDDARRVAVILNGQPDPGPKQGTGPIKAPKFVSCGCVGRSFIACLGMFMVSITYLFFALSHLTLLGIVALLSVMFPKLTVGGMSAVKEFQERCDILCRRPPPPPPPAEAKAV